MRAAADMVHTVLRVEVFGLIRSRFIFEGLFGKERGNCLQEGCSKMFSAIRFRGKLTCVHCFVNIFFENADKNAAQWHSALRQIYHSALS